MTIKEVKLQSLRLMFADTDVEFSTTEYDAGTLLANANTREKLIRMTDSIARGIDMYNNLMEQETASIDLGLYSTTVSSVTTYFNIIDLVAQTNLQFPTRVDVMLYETVNNVTTLVRQDNQINFTYDALNRRVYFLDINYAKYYNEYDQYSLVFKVWYKVKKLNFVAGTHTDETDLATFNIPLDVQRMIPYFVKGELYEEDELAVAQQAKQEFIRFVTNLSRPFNVVQTKAKRAKVFNK
jgi:hypothetical protein